jgi:hypothetical protein
MPLSSGSAQTGSQGKPHRYSRGCRILANCACPVQISHSVLSQISNHDRGVQGAHHRASVTLTHHLLQYRLGILRLFECDSLVFEGELLPAGACVCSQRPRTGFHPNAVISKFSFLGRSNWTKLQFVQDNQVTCSRELSRLLTSVSERHQIQRRAKYAEGPSQQSAGHDGRCMHFRCSQAPPELTALCCAVLSAPAALQKTPNMSLGPDRLKWGIQIRNYPFTVSLVRLCCVLRLTPRCSAEAKHVLRLASHGAVEDSAHGAPVVLL